MSAPSTLYYDGSKKFLREIPPWRLPLLDCYLQNTPWRLWTVLNSPLFANDSLEKVTMPKSARAAKLPPIVPSRQGSSGATEESGSRGRGVLSFPLSNRLIITTKKGVYIWDAYGITELFRSGSEGIAAAKKIVIGNEMLAVADSQVVVLHDIGGGLQRSYRLKGSDVGVI